MNITLPAELDQEVLELVRQGAYDDAQEAVIDAIRSLLREREHVSTLLEQNSVDTAKIESWLSDAEQSGEYSPLTSEDWDDIERDGLEALKSRPRP